MTAKQIQCLLAYHDCYSGAIDGVWGPASGAGTLAFQKRAGLEADGIAGPRTQEALKQSVVWGLPEIAPEPEDFWQQIRYFTRQEFACKCGSYHTPYCDGFPAEPKEAMVRIAEAVRLHFGSPVTIVSGLRCRGHNQDSGGVANSQHMAGEAADIYVKGAEPSAVEAFLDTLEGVRYHYTIPGSRNVHFDIPKGG